MSFYRIVVENYDGYTFCVENDVTDESLESKLIYNQELYVGSHVYAVPDDRKWLIQIMRGCNYVESA